MIIGLRPKKEGGGAHIEKSKTKLRGPGRQPEQHRQGARGRATGAVPLPTVRGRSMLLASCRTPPLGTDTFVVHGFALAFASHH